MPLDIVNIEILNDLLEDSEVDYGAYDGVFNVYVHLIIKNIQIVFVANYYSDAPFMNRVEFIAEIVEVLSFDSD